MSQKLREQIDRMVEDSIRRILPGVMNEVLLRAVANSGVIQESRRPELVSRDASPPASSTKKRPKSLGQILDPEAGADFYDRGQTPIRRLAEVQRPSAAIKALPPELRGLAESISSEDLANMDDESAGLSPSVDLGHAQEAAGIDFSRILKTVQADVKKTAKPSSDAMAKAHFEEMRIKRMRESLNGGKPIE